VVNTLYKYSNINKYSIVIIIISFLLYGNTLLNGWNMDDEFVYKDNELVMKGVSSIPKILFTKYVENDHVSFGYRPITKITYAIQHSIFGLNLPISHLINVLLYAISGILLLRFLNIYLSKYVGKTFLFLVTIIWLSHPVHTEVVASLKNREELLWFIFGLLSMIYAQKYVKAGRPIQLIYTFIFFIIAYLSKQSAISLVLLMPFILVYFKDYITISNLKTINFRIIIVGIGISILAYLMFNIPNWFFMPDTMDLSSFENPLIFNKDYELIAATSSYSLITYLRLLLFPHPLIFYYGLYIIPILSINSTIVICSILLHLFLIGILISGYFSKKLIAFGIGFYLLSIFPFSNIIMGINGIVAERFLFMPSVGFAIALTAILFRIFKIDLKISSLREVSKSLKYVIIIILVLYSGKTIIRNNSWKDKITLFSNDIKYAEKSVQANNILADYMLENIHNEFKLGIKSDNQKQIIDSVLLLYKRSLELYPNNYRALNNIGDIYLSFYGNGDSALYYLSTAYELNNKSFSVVFNIAYANELIGNKLNAIRYYKESLDINPRNINAWDKLIKNELSSGNLSEVKSIADKMLLINIQTHIPYDALSFYYMANNDTLNAIYNLEKSFNITKNQNTAKYLANYFYQKKNNNKYEYYRLYSKP